MITTTTHVRSTAFGHEGAVRVSARQAAADPARPAIVMGCIDVDAAPILKVLRRSGVQARSLARALAVNTFANYFRTEPEERQTAGFFTDGVYGISPVMLDSANAETLAFAERFRARFGHEPASQFTI